MRRRSGGHNVTNPTTAYLLFRQSRCRILFGLALFYATEVHSFAQTIVPPNFSNPGYNAPLNYFDRYAASWYECTRYAWGRAYERLNVKTTFTVSTGRDGGKWYDLITPDFQRGSAPRQDSFAVWSDGALGHVAYVETVDNVNVTITEANLDLQGHYAGQRSIPLVNMQVGSNRSGYGLSTAYKLVGYVYLPTGSGSSCVGCGSPSTNISTIFQTAYNIEPTALGTPTGQVTSYTDTFYSPAIAGYYQNFIDAQGRSNSLQLIQGTSQAFSVKWGFSSQYSSISSYRGHKVYDLVVAPTQNQVSGNTSVGGSQYTWQQFLKGSMYFFDSNSQGWAGKLSYVWGTFDVRYQMEGGRTGVFGVPLSEVIYQGSFFGYDYYYQWFERGFIQVAESGNTQYSYAWSYTTNVLSGGGNWIDSPRGWVQH
jgi:surface antigen